jgi:hypothetical protein
MTLAETSGEIQQQRQHAKRQGLHVRNGKADYLRIDAQGAQQRVEEPYRDHQKGCHRKTEVNAVDQRTVTILALPGSERLRN